MHIIFERWKLLWTLYEEHWVMLRIWTLQHGNISIYELFQTFKGWLLITQLDVFEAMKLLVSFEKLYGEAKDAEIHKISVCFSKLCNKPLSLTIHYQCLLQLSWVFLNVLFVMCEVSCGFVMGIVYFMMEGILDPSNQLVLSGNLQWYVTLMGSWMCVICGGVFCAMSVVKAPLKLLVPRDF